MASKKIAKKKKSLQNSPEKHEDVLQAAASIPEMITDESTEGGATISSVKSEGASTSRRSSESGSEELELDECQVLYFATHPEQCPLCPVESKMTEMNLEAPSSSKESGTGQELTSKSIAEVLGVSGEPEYNLVQHPQLSVEELVVNDIILRTKEVRLSPIGFHTVHIVVLVLSGELADKFVEMLNKRADEPNIVFVADPYTTVARQAKMIAERKVQIVCGTIERINRLMGTKYMKKMALRVVYFIDAGIMFNDPYYRGAIDRFFSNFPEHPRLIILWSNDAKIERLHQQGLQVQYYNLIPHGLVKSMHFYVIMPQKNKDNELEAIAQLRERYQEQRMVIYCQVKVVESTSKKLREKHKVKCLVLLPQMNFEQRSKIYRKFSETKKAILLTTSHFNGMINTELGQQIIVINYYLPSIYEYVRRVVFFENEEQNPLAHFYTLIYEDQVDDLKKLRDKLQLKWIEKTFVLYSQ